MSPSFRWKTCGSSGGRARSIQQTADGDYVVAGDTVCFDSGYPDSWILKLNSDGEIPGCALPVEGHAIVSDTSAFVTNTGITPKTSLIVPANTSTARRTVRHRYSRFVLPNVKKRADSVQHIPYESARLFCGLFVNPEPKPFLC